MITWKAVLFKHNFIVAYKIVDSMHNKTTVNFYLFKDLLKTVLQTICILGKVNSTV